MSSQEGYERAQALLARHFRVLGSNERTAADKKWANDNHKAIHRNLKQLCKRAGNQECADCTATRPGWTALPHGIHICINCAQIHRRIGRHISQVKSIFSGTYHWHRDEINVMKVMGNNNAARLYLGGKGGNRVPKPNKNAGVETIEKYIRAKYERGEWLNNKFTLAPKPKAAKPSAPKTSTTSRPGHSQKLVSALENSSWTPTQTVAALAPPPAAKAAVTAPAQTVGPDTDFFSMFDMKPTIAKTVTKPVPNPATRTSAWEKNTADILNLF